MGIVNKKCRYDINKNNCVWKHYEGKYYENKINIRKCCCCCFVLTANIDMKILTVCASAIY